jgi:hypothetical protein
MHLPVKRCFGMFLDQCHVIAPDWRYDREVWPRPLAKPKCRPSCFWILRVWELSSHICFHWLMLPAAGYEFPRMGGICQPSEIKCHWIGQAERPPLVTQFQFEALKAFLKDTFTIFSFGTQKYYRCAQDLSRQRVSISQANYDFQDMCCSLRGGSRVFPFALIPRQRTNTTHFWKFGHSIRMWQAAGLWVFHFSSAFSWRSCS